MGPKSSIGWLKNDFSFEKLKVKLDRIKSATKCLCENVQRHSCSTVIPLSDFCSKNEKFEPPFLDRGNIRTPSVARWKAGGRLYIRCN